MLPVFSLLVCGSSVAAGKIRSSRRGAGICRSPCTGDAIGSTQRKKKLWKKKDKRMKGFTSLLDVKLREEVMHRDRWRCQYCMRRAKTIDHVIPRTSGGLSIPENAVAACYECNSKKGRHSLKHFLSFEMDYLCRVTGKTTTTPIRKHIEKLIRTKMNDR